MSDQHDNGDGTMDGRMTDGVWQPLPHGADYDADQTMHVSFAAQLAMPGPGTEPLAAPGQGYAPNPWEPAPGEPPAAMAPEAPSGTWSIPTVGDSADESGEYSVGSYAGTVPAFPAAAPGGHPEAAPEPQDIPAAEQGGQTDQTDQSGQAGQTGQWALPFTADDGPEETGEYPIDRPEEAAEPPSVEQEPEQLSDLQPDLQPGQETGPELEQQPEAGPAAEEPHGDHALASYVLSVNGAARPVTDAWLGESLLYVLRERLGLAGAKDGCEQGECGACSVQVDGRLVASCLVPAATAAGSEVRTVEGLASHGRPSDVQRALAESGAVQCGFCVPGLAMTVHDLLEGNHNPTELETRQAICGNLCRCSGYRGVLDAVRDVVAARAAAEAAAPDEAPDTAARIPHQSGPGGAQ